MNKMTPKNKISANSFFLVVSERFCNIHPVNCSKSFLPKIKAPAFGDALVITVNEGEEGCAGFA